jgi:hypothetical protein
LDLTLQGHHGYEVERSGFPAANVNRPFLGMLLGSRDAGPASRPSILHAYEVEAETV